jgi:hypothetical protein
VSAEIVGQVSIGQCIPTTASLVATLIADFTAKLTGALQLQASITLTPPTIATSITATLELVAQLQAQLALSISLGLPEVSVDLTVMLAVIADLNASLAALLALNITLGTAGVYVLKHEGDAPTFGSEMQAQISTFAPAGNAVHAVTFLATDPAVFEALGTVLLTG